MHEKATKRLYPQNGIGKLLKDDIHKNITNQVWVVSEESGLRNKN